MERGNLLKRGRLPITVQFSHVDLLTGDVLEEKSAKLVQ